MTKTLSSMFIPTHQRDHRPEGAAAAMWLNATSDYLLLQVVVLNVGRTLVRLFKQKRAPGAENELAVTAAGLLDATYAFDSATGPPGKRRSPGHSTIAGDRCSQCSPFGDSDIRRLASAPKRAARAFMAPERRGGPGRTDRGTPRPRPRNRRRPRCRVGALWADKHRNRYGRCL